MRASLGGKMLRSKQFAPLVGTVLYFAWLTSAWASEAEEGHHHLNWTDFTYRTVAIVIVLAVLIKLLRKPMANFLTARREEIQRLLSELEVKISEARSEQAKAQAKLASLEEDTRKIINELIAEGEAEKQKIIEAAHRQAEYIQQQAQVAIQQEIQAARDSLREEVAELSVAAAQDIIQKRMQAEDQQRLVREFMIKVVEAK
ncbi:MAG: ATP synthase F0 subunit B [Syntrophobacteraceae bacterium]